MNKIESRDFYTVIAAGMGGLLALTVSILAFPDSPAIVGMSSIVGAEAGVIILIKALRIFEEFQGLEWRLEQK